MTRKPEGGALMRPRRWPRSHYAEMGRKGGEAKAAARRGLVPSLRAAVDKSLLRRGAADSYARSLSELHAARAFAEDAYWAGDAGAIRRALRWVASANALADRCYELLVEAGEQ